MSDHDSKTVRLPTSQYRKLVYLSVGTDRGLGDLLAEAVDLLAESHTGIALEITTEANALLERTPVHPKRRR